MKRLIVSLSGAGVVFAIWILYAVFVKDVEVLRNTNTWPGTFGDSFGALNTLFTGLAFAGLIASIVLQSQELALQREELTLQRTVLEGQSKELASQAEAMRRSAEAQERTAAAQERTAQAQARSMVITAKVEQLRATEMALQAMSANGDKTWLGKKLRLQDIRNKLIEEISAIAEASGESPSHREAS